MKLDICRVDSNRNFSEKELAWLVSAIDSFSKNIAKTKISSYGGRINNSSDAFAFYALPAFDNGNAYSRNFQFSEDNLLSKNQSNYKNAAALACACRINGLLDDYDSFFELTPIARELLATKKISTSEYAFILLSKQWICLDDEYVEPFLFTAWRLINKPKSKFLDLLNTSSTASDWSEYVFAEVAGKSFQKGDKVSPARADMVKNMFLLSGLLSLGEKGLEIPENSLAIWKDFCKTTNKISKPQIGEKSKDTDNLYYHYVGSIEHGGIIDVLKKENANIYAVLYPNLVDFFFPNTKKNVKSIQVNPDNYVKTQEQIIFYGVPGSGKSTTLREKLTTLKIPHARIRRTGNCYECRIAVQTVCKIIIFFAHDKRNRIPFIIKTAIPPRAVIGVLFNIHFYLCFQLRKILFLWQMAICGNFLQQL